MHPSTDQTLQELCRVKKQDLRGLQEENTRLHLQIVRARASIARLQFEAVLLEEHLRTAESEDAAVGSTSEEASDACSCVHVPSAAENSAMANDIQEAGNVCSKRSCQDTTAGENKQCAEHLSRAVNSPAGPPGKQGPADRVRSGRQFAMPGRFGPRWPKPGHLIGAAGRRITR